MHDFSLFIEKLKNSTSLRENKNKASFLLQASASTERYSSQSHSALYWALVANKAMWETAKRKSLSIQVH